MAIIAKNIFLVKTDRENFEAFFSRKKNSEIINYYEIRQKLINNDSSKIPPSEEIINCQIIKKLNNFKICKKTEFIYILKNEIDLNFILDLKKIIGKSFVPIYYYLLVSDDKKYDEIKEEFHLIKKLDYDKSSNT